jgi:hypothetical protein
MSFELFLFAFAFAFATLASGSFHPIGGSPVRVSPNSAFRPVSHTGSTPVSVASGALELPASLDGAPGIVFPQFGHLALSRASSPVASKMESLRGPSGFPSADAVFGFAEPTHPPVPVHHHTNPIGAFGAPFAFGQQQHPAFPTLVPSPAASHIGGGFNFAGAAFNFAGPALPPLPVQHHAAAMGAVAAPFGFGHQQFPGFPTHAPSWVPGLGQMAQPEGDMFSKRRRVHSGIDDA